MFFAAVKPEDVQKNAANDFLDRLFEGDPMSLMIHFAKHGKISDDDIKKLKDLIKMEN